MGGYIIVDLDVKFTRLNIVVGAIYQYGAQMKNKFKDPKILFYFLYYKS